MVESDLEVACNLVRNRSHSTALLKLLMEIFLQVLDREWTVSIHHIYRETNFCVDWLANHASNLCICAKSLLEAFCVC